MKTFVAILTITSTLAVPVLPAGAHSDEIPAAKGTKATLVYQQELPNVPGNSLKGVLVEYERGGLNSSHTHACSAVIYATVLEGPAPASRG